MRPYLTFTIAASVACGAAAALLVAAASADPTRSSAGDGVAQAARAVPASGPVVGISLPAAQQFVADVAGDVSFDDALQQRRPRTPHSFYFTRGIYSEYRRGRGWGGRSWAVDYPKADNQFVTVLRRLTILDVYNSENAVALDDPELRRYPFLYMLEVGDIGLTPGEAQGLRDYLLAGGFVFIDDFWGSREWAGFYQEMQRVFPDYPVVELSMDHPVFSSFYHITEIMQVPNQRNAQWGDRTWEQDGIEPKVFGIFDDNGRLMMMINWNTDIGDAWEWAEQPYYPLKYSTFAFQIGVNAIVYAMSH